MTWYGNVGATLLLVYGVRKRLAAVRRSNPDAQFLSLCLSLMQAVVPRSDA